MPLKPRKDKFKNNPAFRQGVRNEGEGKQPRSYGRVLRSIREGMGLTQSQMFDKICEVPNCSFDLSKEVQELRNESYVKLSDGTFDHGKIRETKRRRARHVNRWECSEIYIPFSIQFRYALLTGTRNGVGHLVSAYYADFRGICDVSNTPDKKQDLLDKVNRNLKGLKAFTELFERFVEDINRDEENSHLQKWLENKETFPLERDNTQYHLRFIFDLIEAYADGEIYKD